MEILRVPDLEKHRHEKEGVRCRVRYSNVQEDELVAGFGYGGSISRPPSLSGIFLGNGSHLVHSSPTGVSSKWGQWFVTNRGSSRAP